MANGNLYVGIDGELYRDRGRDGQRGCFTIRENYERHHRDIETVADLKATLRAGAFAWPGGYPLYFITADGAALSFAAVRAEFGSVVWSIRNEVNDGWRVVACDIAFGGDDDDAVYCDHTGERID